MQPTVYVISDIHLGPGRDPDGNWNILEDFREDEALCSFLAEISQASHPIELVIAGDFIEYPQILPHLSFNSPDDKLGCSEDESVERTAVLLGQRPEIASGHPRVFTALREVMKAGHSITIIPGNHDVDILWERVWAMLFDAIYPPGASSTLKLVPFSYTVGQAVSGQVIIQHGHEHDAANCFGDEMQSPFDNDHDGICRLKRCWGTLFVDKVYNQLESRYRFIDNVKPMSKVIKLGLRHDVFFTAPAVLAIISFVFTSNAPIGQYLSATLGPEPEALLSDQRDIDELVAVVDDPDLRAYLERMARERPDDYRELAHALQTMNEHEWQELRTGSGEQRTLDQDLAQEEPTATLGLFGGDEDPYLRSVRDILEANPAADVVIFGHTHAAYDGLSAPIYLDNRRAGYYFNSGTWTQAVRERPGQPLSWDDLANEDSYVSVKTYLKLTPDSKGRYRVSMHNWEG